LHRDGIIGASFISYGAKLMNDVTQILSQIEQGDPSAAEELLPLVYDELRKLAADRLANEKPGQTLQPTALVHEAYIRLVDKDEVAHWNSRGHFFAAAAEAMRRILVENARRKGAAKRGGGLERVDLDDAQTLDRATPEMIVAISDALEKLAVEDPVKAELVKLRCFAGLSHQDAASALGISRPTADRYWVYAKTHLYCEIFEPD
jgi:RNA polymerase sigma factor (TIGR02999 family)